ncbi:MAG: thioesterase family protein [Pseudomonadota bacterium]
MPRPRAPRTAYAHFQTMTTRWRDNDVYGHLNNAVYYEYVDAAVNAWILSAGALEIPDGPVVGLVVESGCTYHAPLGFPEAIDVGLSVSRIGTSAVTYEVGLFASDSPLAAAEARFVHVYVEAETRRPVSLPATFRRSLEALSADGLR